MAAELLDRVKEVTNGKESPGAIDEESGTAERKAGRRVSNPEIIALNTIVTELEKLSPAAQARVSAYLWGWCQERGATAINNTRNA